MKMGRIKKRRTLNLKEKKNEAVSGGKFHAYFKYQYLKRCDKSNH